MPPGGGMGDMGGVCFVSRGIVSRDKRNARFGGPFSCVLLSRPFALAWLRRRHALHLHDRSAPARIIEPPRQLALLSGLLLPDGGMAGGKQSFVDRKSTRLNSSH